MKTAPSLPDASTPKTPTLSELMDAAQACEAAGHFAQAHHWLQQCSKQLGEHPASSKHTAAIQSALWRLSPLWWVNLQHGGLTLRRCRAADADFFRRCFNDPVFSHQFNRQQPWRGDLGAALAQSGKLPPLKTGLLMWVVESSTLGPIGLASLSSLDTVNLRAELSIGFPGAVPPTLGIKATLMMLHFALVMMPFHKVYAYVYQDNPQALHNTIRLGFVHEGKWFAASYPVQGPQSERSQPGRSGRRRFPSQRQATQIFRLEVACRDFLARRLFCFSDLLNTYHQTCCTRDLNTLHKAY